MDIILLRKNRSKSSHLTINKSIVVSLGALVFIALPVATLSLGYYWANSTVAQAPTSEEVVGQVLADQRQELDAVIESTKHSMTALSVRMAELQAHAIRLDALGKRLIELNKLDEREFDFGNPPAVGGPEGSAVMEEMPLSDFLEALDALSRQLDERGAQLTIMEDIFMHENLRSETIPSGRPVESGWLSSGFGRRTDPFSGKLAYHEGVDFAGKTGTGVIAAASGVVTWSGERYGYGRMVEIDHGNGYVTRYAHNKENKVEVGEIIEKGQILALMGSSGWSTGPHVHYEVLRNGKPVDPKRYIYR